MELKGKYYSIGITMAQLIDLIPETVWKKDIEQVILKKAKEEYGNEFNDIDYQDCEENEVHFGLSS